MHVWLVTTFEPLPIDDTKPMRAQGLADSLRSRGHRVTVWAPSFFHHTRNQRSDTDQRFEVAPGYAVEIIRSWGYRRSRIWRLVAHRHFAFRLGRRLSRAAAPDLVVVLLPPLSVTTSVVRAARGLEVPVVVDVIDPWPDVYVLAVPPAARPLAAMLVRPLRWRLRRALATIAAGAALSGDYVDWLRRRGLAADAPAEPFYPAVDVGSVPLPAPAAGGRRLRFVYAGALAKSYDVGLILACARRLAADPGIDVEFVIAGDGPMAEELRAAAADLPSVQFAGWLDGDALRTVLAEADIGLALYRKGATQSITYKLFDYLAAGLPIVCSLPGEMSDIIEREEVGVAIAPGDAAALESAVRGLAGDMGRVVKMRSRARDVAERLGDGPVVYGRFSMFLEAVARG